MCGHHAQIKPLLSITLHWINDEWKMYCILLDLIPLHERNTGITLANNVYTNTQLLMILVLVKRL